MSTIYQQIRTDIVTALKARDPAKTLILRSTDAAIQRTSLDSNQPINDDLVIATLTIATARGRSIVLKLKEITQSRSDSS